MVTSFAQGKIECYCGPEDLRAPDDLEAVITGFIGQTTKTLDIAVQELDSCAIAEAVIAKKREGKSVRVLLNRSYLQDETDAEHRPDPALTTVAQLAADESERKVNRDVFAALCRCGVEVRIDFNPDDKIFLHKFALRDVRLTDDGRARRGEQPGLPTGSATFTHTDCHANLNLSRKSKKLIYESILEHGLFRVNEHRSETAELFKAATPCSATRPLRSANLSGKKA